MIVLGVYKGKWGILVRIEKFSSKTYENQLPTFQSLVFHSRIVFEVRTFFLKHGINNTFSPEMLANTDVVVTSLREPGVVANLYIITIGMHTIEDKAMIQPMVSPQSGYL